MQVDDATWTEAVSIAGNRSSRTVHPVAMREARYVRFTATKPTNSGDNKARIYELEVYGNAS